MLARAYEDTAQPGEDWRFMWDWKMEARKTGIGNALGLGFLTQELQRSCFSHCTSTGHSTPKNEDSQSSVALFCLPEL